ncbi:hypothetical protein D3C83_220940 [compost metagenome]
MASPSSTVATNQIRVMRTSRPNRAVFVNSRHATAKGAVHITRSMTFADSA